ncbi:Histidine kinase [Purpureocillium takamizusanense]|uniref:histidine kinase n=1 Tax=Purpureocillium takamizusanense TaxID=2060973 RepID=A0A9Q8QD24_9HYPO|nr:Histidine kinase [Purpureocillium takamizusanense]UNI16976.1 Histidine kinase [Purpureocillium takamizusanense]
MKLRVAIREQLAALVILAVLVALAIVSIPTWVYVHNFVVDVESSGLSLTASLKASRVASELDLLYTLCQTVATRVLLQQAFIDFYNGNATEPFANARVDLHSAMSTSRLTNLLQARLYSRNVTGSSFGLLNVTGAETGDIDLLYNTPNGTRAKLSDTSYGYPPSLYPNITYESLGYPNPYEPSTPAFSANAFPGVRISDKGGLLLGPLVLNESYALMSLTVPVRSLNTTNFILGYMTLVASAETLLQVQTSREGLGSSGVVLFIGPSSPSNHFISPLSPTNSTYSPPKDEFARSPARYVLPPISMPGEVQRHASRDYVDGRYDADFSLSDYPAVFDVYYRNISGPNNATALLSTTNEQDVRVAVGVARPQSTLVDWAVVVEKAEAEAYVPISTLRKILLGCVFGTAGLVIIFIFPTAHLSVLPIRRLKAATEKSINPPGYEDEYDDFDEDPSSGGTSSGSRKGVFAKFRRRFRKRKRPLTQAEIESHRRVFKIPGRVEDRKHFVTDELTELTETFNEMTDELLKQYTSLDEKVAERTKELEISKRAAEAANESKTLFIANISHELKTPLNGIMGMCAVCMEEDDIMRIKQSLKTLYRSGDLLLHLLEDLLSFSKNQIGQHVSLEEREFRLGEIRSQMLSIFDKQVRESKVTFTASFVGSDSADSSTSPDRTGVDQRLPALGPLGMGRLKDAYLWGDQHRILQVIINLVSNSLKFTPAGGRVELRMRCIGEAPPGPGEDDRKSSTSLSKTTSARVGRSRHRGGGGSGSTHSASSRATTAPASSHKAGTALSINPMDPAATPHVYIRERSPTPPPPNAKPFLFEFQVEDTGRGIPEHMLEKVFEPFVQGDLGLSKKFGGTGLGLSICAQLAKLMGGSIAVKSTIGVGSMFTMQIPLKYVRDRVPSTASSSTKSRPPSVGSAAGAAGDTHRNSLGSVASVSEQKTANTNGKSSVLEDKQPRLIGLSAPFFASNPHAATPTSKQDQHAAIDKAIANKAGRGKLRVLVADDNSTNIEVVSRMLKLEDVYDVTIAKDGQEAYELVKANMEKNKHFDVIFMDIQMPNLDGLQSTRLIRKMGYLAPIVALTAFSEESNVKECMESGMDEFLAKPIRRPALKKVLTKFATIPEEPETSGIAKKAELEVKASPVNGSTDPERDP